MKNMPRKHDEREGVDCAGGRETSNSSSMVHMLTGFPTIAAGALPCACGMHAHLLLRRRRLLARLRRPILCPLRARSARDMRVGALPWVSMVHPLREEPPVERDAPAMVLRNLI